MLDVAEVATAGGDDELWLEGVSVANRLDDVSLSASPGEIVGLAGIAGAGHSTVVELVSGQRRAEDGRVLLPGGAPGPEGPARRDGPRRRARVGRPPPVRPDARQAAVGEHRAGAGGRAGRRGADRPRP